MADRIAGIDRLRGLVMVLMTLDHVRDFFSAAHFDPTDLARTTPALFFTRWITHFCAPVFIFLAGTSAHLWAEKRGTDAPIGRFLLERGLILLLLERTVEAWAWNFRHDWRLIDGGVLWAIGWSMIALAGLVKLPGRWVMGLALAMIGLHNAFDGVRAADMGRFGPWWSVLHSGEPVDLGGGWAIKPYYPLLPWIGVMAAGYGFGRRLAQDRSRRDRTVVRWGVALTIGFVLLRFPNVYGDARPWQLFGDWRFSVMSFLNCEKYPPSLLYLLMTLGPALIVLVGLESSRFGRARCLEVCGRTPLFFYLLHLYWIHALALGLAALAGGPVDALIGGAWDPEIPAGYGYGLGTVYAIWLLVLVTLFPLCRWFEAFKAERPHWRWLRYL
jgi:uncharacterized membrane protein